jgi:ABC-2 type transport system ATP-binding protein
VTSCHTGTTRGTVPTPATQLAEDPAAAGMVPVSAITVRNLVKNYADVEAVRGISFDVAQGEVFALLGPNGAGKSTTVEILEGHRTRTSGEVTVLACDPSDHERSLRERIGIVLQETAVEEQLTVSEAITIYGAMYPKRRRTDEIVDIVGLGEKRDARIKTLSGGQRRRLELALGIVGDPELIFLDEPTTGFDPSARRQAWSIVQNLTSLGKTVLLTTHYMDEAQVLADRVAVIAKGEIVAEGSPESLGGRESAATVISFHPNRAPLEGLPAAEPHIAENGRVTLRTTTPTRTIHDVTGWALDRGIELSDLTITRPSLEDVYLELTGDEAGV